MNNSQIHQILCKKGDLPFISFAGRANVLLYSIFKTLPAGSKVIFPAIMCPSPLLVAEYAGLIPILADVTSNGLLSVESVNQIIKDHRDISAVLSVNLYGQRPPNYQIRQTFNKENIILIEDGAQWWAFDSLGMDADVSILSFGSKKVIDCGGGGIALTANKTLFDAMEFEKDSIEFTKSSKLKELSSFYSTLYYSLADSEKINHGTMKKFGQFKDQLKELYFPDDSHFSSQNILKGLQNATINFRKRYEWAKKYESFFSNNSLFEVFMELYPNAGPWRYSVLFSGKDKNGFLQYLRDRQIDVSSWYPCLSKLGFNDDKTNCSESIAFSERVLNFWVDDMDQIKFEKTKNVIKSYREII